MNYKCDRCGYTSEYLGNLKTHLHRKNECKPILENISRQNLINKLFKNVHSNTFPCRHCDKSFSHQSTRSHHEKLCRKVSKEILIQLQQQVLEMSKEIKELKIANNTINDKLNKTEGYIYLMQSQVHPTFFKIGRTIDLKDREKSLMKDNTYKTYQLKIIKYYHVDNYFQKEKELHDKFLQFRYCKSNGYNCDTELFIINDKENFIKNFEETFKI